MDEKNVRVITPYVGGGFGGKGVGTQSVEVARIAKLAGRPVQLAWTRKEEFAYDTFRPAAVMKVRSGLDAKGSMNLWDYTVYYAGRRGSESTYDVPHMRVLSSPSGRSSAHPLRTGAWRAPGANNNAFARESQIDMTAAKAGLDPFEFRMKHLSNEKLKRVLKKAADAFGYTPAKGPSGRGIGMAIGFDAGTWVASFAQARVDRKTGQIRIERVVCAQDMGLCVNPRGATIQMEGCIMMGLGYALTEGVRFKGGQVLDENFDTYQLPRFSWMPKIETHIIPNQDEDPQGGGEPAIILMGAIVANALYDATGARCLYMPMTPERVLEALKEV
jgi:CO/xanthine dehydrogenase Mo-binding subunit